MTVKINKWGNNLGIELPKQVSDNLQLENGTELEMEVRDSGIFLKKVKKKRKITLEYLLKGMTEENQHEALIPDITKEEEW